MGDGFLKRWSRRKMAEGEAAAKLPADPPQSPEPDAGTPLPRASAQAGSAAKAPPPDTAEEAIDPATLPPIESLGPESDYTVFLKKGVPEPLRIAALRKAWMSDPFIRDFRGPAEYALDYTTPEFDLRPTDDVAKMLDQIFPPKSAADAAAEAEAQPNTASKELPKPVESSAPQPIADQSLPQKQAQPAAPSELQPAAPETPGNSPARRKHGGALPG